MVGTDAGGVGSVIDIDSVSESAHLLRSTNYCSMQLPCRTVKAMLADTCTNRTLPRALGYLGLAWGMVRLQLFYVVVLAPKEPLTKKVMPEPMTGTSCLQPWLCKQA